MSNEFLKLANRGTKITQYFFAGVLAFIFVVIILVILNS